MTIHKAVEKLKETIETLGIDDCDLIFRHLPENEHCQFASGEVMSIEFGGRVAECTTPNPFTAKMKLENLFDAPLKTEKTKAAAMGALNVVTAFLMLTRKTKTCNSVFAEDCINELASFCNGKKVHIIGLNNKIITEKSENIENADLILINGEAFLDDKKLEEIEKAIETKKDIRLIGPNCHGLAALLHIPVWCPYST